MCDQKRGESVREGERERGRASGEYFSESSSESGSRQERKPPFFFSKESRVAFSKT